MRDNESGALKGLTPGEATARLRKDGPNELPTDARPALGRQVWNVVRQPMLGLLIAAGTINVVLSEPLDGAVLLVFVFIIVGISIYQGNKTETALAALRDLSAPRALVVRGGERIRIPGRDVVTGDVLLVSEGDRVPADAVLVESRAVTVDESALTGESIPVSKSCATPDAPMGPPGGDGSPWLFLGTLVVKGQGIAVVRSTGARTELGRIGSSLSRIETSPTPLQTDIDRIVRIVAVAGLSVAALVVVVHGVVRGGWLESVLLGIATAMSMIPEEFPVVLTVFLALGAWRMSQRRVLARRSAAIETLGAATVVCVDKTGTLTMNKMEVHEMIADGCRIELDDSPVPAGFHTLIECAMLASPVDPFDPMDKAFRELGERMLPEIAQDHRQWELVHEYPLSPDLMALSHVWRRAAGEQLIIAAKGAPEAIFDLCHLDHEAQAGLLQQVEQSSARGLRILAVARATFDGDSGLPGDQHCYGFRFVGLVGLRDPVRPGVSASIEEFGRAGVRTVMVTGDYPGTGVAVASEIGLPYSDSVLTGAEVARMSDAELARSVRTTGVFARMVPDQKLRLVRAFASNGDVVGMTGDGVNDAPALRAADIGIAMGARGTDVAREAADLVIADDDFTSIVNGVRQGRGIYDNLRKALSYVVAMHVPIVGMVMVPILGPEWPLVLLPVQIAFVEMIIDPACSVVFETEQADPAIMDEPPRRPDEPLFSRRMLAISLLQGSSVLAATLGVYGWAMAQDYSPESVRSIAFSCLTLSNLGLILVNRSWRLTVRRTFRERRNPSVKWILLFGAIMLSAVLVVPWFRRAFGFGPMTLMGLAAATLGAAAGVSWFEVYKVVRSGAFSSRRSFR